MRTLLLTGPGGAGTSTLAAAAAVRVRPRRAAHRCCCPGRRRRVPGPGRRRRASTSSASTRRRPSSGCGAARPARVGAVVPQLTLPPDSSVVPLPGHRRARAVRRAGARRGRPRRPGRRPARGDGRAGGAAVGAALVARPAHAARHAGAGRRPDGRGRDRGRASGDRSTPRSPPSPSSRGCWPATGWPTADDRAAWSRSRGGRRVPALRAAVTTLALHGLTAGARAHPGAAARRRGGVGGPAGRRAGRRPGRPRRAWRPVHRVPEHAVPPADVDELAGLLDGFAPPGRPIAPGRPRPSGTRAAGS